MLALMMIGFSADDPPSGGGVSSLRLLALKPGAAPAADRVKTWRTSGERPLAVQVTSSVIRLRSSGWVSRTSPVLPSNSFSPASPQKGFWTTPRTVILWTPHCPPLPSSIEHSVSVTVYIVRERSTCQLEP